MGWQTDVIKYGMIVGGAGVGVWFLSKKIGGALSGPAEAAGEAWNATGEALGTAGAAIGDAFGGAGETAGNYFETVTNCPMCNGWPNAFGTPCEQCAEHGQKDLPGETQGGDPSGVVHEGCVGQMCDHQDAADANQGGDIKADKPIEVFEWKWPWDPVGDVTKVQDDPNQESWYENPVPGLLEAGADIQRFFFGGHTIAEVLSVDNVVEQTVPQGTDFNQNTGYTVGATGIADYLLTPSLNTGNNVLDGTAATVDPSQVNSTGGWDPFGGLLAGVFGSPTVNQQPTYDNTVHANTNSNGLSSSTVVNTSSPSVTVNNTAEANFNASSTQVNTSTNVAGNTGQSGAHGHSTAGAGGNTSSSNSNAGSTTSTAGGTPSGVTTAGGGTSKNKGSGRFG